MKYRFKIQNTRFYRKLEISFRDWVCCKKAMICQGAWINGSPFWVKQKEQKESLKIMKFIWITTMKRYFSKLSLGLHPIEPFFSHLFSINLWVEQIVFHFVRIVKIKPLNDRLQRWLAIQFLLFWMFNL